MLSRRRFLKRAFTLAAAAPFLPAVSLARADTEKRLVVVVLRGALDGLAAVPAYGDGHYASVRGELALAGPGSPEGVLKLDGLFGLHPELSGFHESYSRGDAAVIHAAATPYRERSHFDGQNLLENGTTRPFGAADGWLNRAIAAAPGAGSGRPREYGVALAQNVPLILRGSEAVGSWAPSTLPDVSDETVTRIMDLYAEDEFFATRLARALETEAMAPDANGRVRNGPRALLALAEAAAVFLADDSGPRIAVLEAGGWDTHANQGGRTGQLASRLRLLDQVFAALEHGLDAVWPETVLIAVSEFGRTAGVNGTKGTDHGTGGVMLLAGGAVRGGRVVADWPGLRQSELYQGRDLAPTTDIRSVLKGILMEHMSLTEAALEQRVFPGSRSAVPLSGLTAGA